MKLSEKFLNDLRTMVKNAHIEKNFWVGKLVDEIVKDHMQERGIKLDDLEGVVLLTVDEAILCLNMARLFKRRAQELNNEHVKDFAELEHQLMRRIEQVEGKE